MMRLLLACGTTDRCAVQALLEQSRWMRRRPPMPQSRLPSLSSTPPTPLPALPPPQTVRPRTAPPSRRPRRGAARRLPPTGPPMRCPARPPRSAMRSQGVAGPLRLLPRRRESQRLGLQPPRRPRRRAQSWPRPQMAARRMKRRRGPCRHAGRAAAVPAWKFLLLLHARTQPVPHRAWQRQPLLRRLRRAALRESAMRALVRTVGGAWQPRRAGYCAIGAPQMCGSVAEARVGRRGRGVPAGRSRGWTGSWTTCGACTA